MLKIPNYFNVLFVLVFISLFSFKAQGKETLNSFGLTGIYTRGETNMSQLGQDFFWRKEFDEYTFMSIEEEVSFIRKEKDRDRLYRGRLALDRYFGSRLSVFASSDYKKSTARSIDHSSESFIGGGYSFWGDYKGLSHFRWSMGLGHRETLYYNGEKLKGPILSNRLRFRLKKKKRSQLELLFSHVFALEEGADYRWDMVARVLYFLTDGLMAGVTYTWTYENTLRGQTKEKLNQVLKYQFSYLF